VTIFIRYNFQYNSNIVTPYRYCLWFCDIRFPTHHKISLNYRSENRICTCVLSNLGRFHRHYRTTLTVKVAIDNGYLVQNSIGTASEILTFTQFQTAFYIFAHLKTKVCIYYVLVMTSKPGKKVVTWRNLFTKIYTFLRSQMCYRLVPFTILFNWPGFPFNLHMFNDVHINNDLFTFTPTIIL
jgi:hypothetical protein